MKSIFKIGTGAAAGVVLTAILWAACSRAPRPGAPDGGDAQRLVAVLDYVAGDYRLAVHDGQVKSTAEYEEQVSFAGDARRMAGTLVGTGAPPNDPLLAAVSQLESRVKAKAPPEAVERASRIARDEVMGRFHLQTVPTQRPSLAQGRELYAQACAVCHGVTGDGQSERALTLDPRPASFRDPERLRDLSPYRVYNALTFGVAGTSMASFETLSPPERWDLAFYVFRLGHEGAPARQVAMTLGDLASRSDREILDALRYESYPDPAGGLVYARTEAAFHEPAAGVGVTNTRRMLSSALFAFRGGRREEAERNALDAYLQGFEPLEPRLRARDPQGTAAIESKFRDLRAALTHGPAGAVEERWEDLDQALRHLDGDKQAVMPSLSAFLIYVREGIEAALLVAALLAGLRRLGRPEARRYVHFGWLLALPAGLVTWWFSERVIAMGGTSQRELVEALVALIAAAVLFSVSFWMISQAESRHWMSYLRRQLEQTLTRRNLLLLAGLSFLAVYREAAETVLFTQALLLENGSQRLQVWLGALGGMVVVFGVAMVMSRTVVKLPLRPFFAVSGILLCGLAISFAGGGIYELVAGGYLSPRPVRFPEVPWLGIHPDLTGLLVQLTIAGVIAVAALSALLKRPPQPASDAVPSRPRPL